MFITFWPMGILIWLILGMFIAMLVANLATRNESKKEINYSTLRQSTIILTILLWPVAVIYILTIAINQMFSQKNPNK